MLESTAVQRIEQALSELTPGEKARRIHQATRTVPYSRDASFG